MKNLLKTLVITFFMLSANASYCQEATEKELQKLTKEFTKDIKKLTLQSAPKGKKSAWYQFAKELGSSQNQEKILEDLRENLPAMQDVPGGQDAAAKKYFAQYKEQLNNATFDNRPGLDEAGAMPYPFCVINDSCED